MGLFFGLIRVAGLFRVDPKDEEEGLDHSYHGGSAYGDTDGAARGGRGSQGIPGPPCWL